MSQQIRNRRQPVYLLAGGRAGRRRTPDPLIQAVFREAGRASPTVAYVGTANGDDAGFFAYMAEALRQAGAYEVNHAQICPQDADLNLARNILKSADVIFISGGDVDRGMRVLKERNLVDFLSRLHRAKP